MLRAGAWRGCVRPSYSEPVSGDEPRLEWGRLAAFDLTRAERMPADLIRAWQVAQESLGLVVRPIERFELAGTLNGHPGHVRSDEAKRPFGAIFALAVASRTAAEPLRGDSFRTAAAALRAWAGTYRPTGNPIDEWFFVPLLQAADLIAPGLDPAGRRTVLDWATEFAVAGDAFFEVKRDRSPARANNWMARRLAPRCGRWSRSRCSPRIWSRRRCARKCCRAWTSSSPTAGGQAGVPGDQAVDRGHRRHKLRSAQQAAGRDLRRAVAAGAVALTSSRGSTAHGGTRCRTSCGNPSPGRSRWRSRAGCSAPAAAARSLVPRPGHSGCSRW
jgi:hypothetical protein